MTKLNVEATAFCDNEVSKPQFSPNERGGCLGCIGADPNKISYGTHITVYELNTNNVIYNGIVCDYCGDAVKRQDILIDLWFQDEETCNQFGRRKVTIEY